MRLCVPTARQPADRPPLTAYRVVNDRSGKIPLIFFFITFRPFPISYLPIIGSGHTGEIHDDNT